MQQTEPHEMQQNVHVRLHDTLDEINCCVLPGQHEDTCTAQPPIEAQPAVDQWRALKAGRSAFGCAETVR